MDTIIVGLRHLFIPLSGLRTVITKSMRCKQSANFLRGEQPADLLPTRYEIVVNQKTAASLGIEVPQPLLTRADEVIR
jgi:hypothetical protein